MRRYLDPLFSISPIDGRYWEESQALAEYCSEYALIRYRIQVEVCYFIALAKESGIFELRRLTKLELAKLQALYQQFDLKAAQRVKKIETVTKHDVKAIEYYIKEQLQRSSLAPLLEFVHFGLTSEDVNNLAYNLMWQEALRFVYLPTLQQLVQWLIQAARRYYRLPMLSLTHGQPATPTTLGKEYNVFAQRLQRQLQQLKQIKFLGKCAGATGTWAAHVAAYPRVNWLQFTTRFVRSLNMTPNLVTTQIESHDRLIESYQTLVRVNGIIRDLDQDMWLYISRRLFIQKNIPGEVGSSTMPHKINPIYFENSEGNGGLANALFNHLTVTLPISRLQRDLTDSTVLRNQGLALAHSLLAIRNTLKALSRVQPNVEQLNTELDEHWELLAEPIQTVLRKSGQSTPYEQLKRLTRGQPLDQVALHSFIDTLKLSEKEKATLKRLTPSNYIGLADRVAQLTNP